MQYLDAHCHIDLYDNPKEVVAQAADAKVGVLAVTNAPFVFDACRKLLSGRKDIYVAAGLHPELVEQYGGQVNALIQLLTETRFVGEVGLDYRVTKPETHQTQRDVFEKIIHACHGNRSVVLSIHSRGAESDVVSMIGERFQGIPIYHWYSGAIKYLKIAQSNGSYFSVNSSMLASKNGRKLICQVDKHRILTETDGPYVKINTKQAQPKNVPQIILGLAELWDEDVEEVRQIVLSNWSRVVSNSPEDSG